RIRHLTGLLPYRVSLNPELARCKFSVNCRRFSRFDEEARDASPAREAGIERGDVILHIDGRSTSGVSLEVIREMLKQPDKTHKITLSRGRKTVSATLRTREVLNGNYAGIPCRTLSLPGRTDPQGRAHRLGRFLLQGTGSGA